MTTVNAQNAENLNRNVVQKVYGSRAGVILFGVVPALILSLYSFLIAAGSGSELFRFHPDWRSLVCLLFGTFSAFLCAIMSISVRGKLGAKVSKILKTSLYVSVGIVFICTLVILQYMGWRGSDTQGSVFRVIYISMCISILVSAVKQINMIKDSEMGRTS